MNKKLGIVGGGQLGLMLAQAAKPLNIDVTVLDPTPNCPASSSAQHILGSFKNADDIFELAKAVDVLTFEIESANANALEELLKQGKSLNPMPQMLALIKDKYQQKVFYQQNDLPCAESMRVESKDEILKAAEKFSYPFLLKARFDAYDGRGNAVVKSPDDIDAAMEKLGAKNLYVEKFVPFIKELSVVVARSCDGEIKSFPLVETIHENNICHTVLCPAPVDTNVASLAQSIAEKLVSHLEGAGVFAVEMFLTADNKILINEVAPRVHNSGHHTIEANQTSQFEQHVRAVMGMPLGEPALKVPAAVMINILGKRQGVATPQGIEAAEAISGVSVHIYGKHDTKPERKMGHITAVANTLAKARENAEQALQLISI